MHIELTIDPLTVESAQEILDNYAEHSKAHEPGDNCRADYCVENLRTCRWPTDAKILQGYATACKHAARVYLMTPEGTLSTVMGNSIFSAELTAALLVNIEKWFAAIGRDTGAEVTVFDSLEEIT